MEGRRRFRAVIDLKVPATCDDGVTAAQTLRSTAYADVLDALARADRWIERLWNDLQADGAYRGRTALVVTTDHGRGRTPDDWNQHGAGVDGAEDVWTAFVVPESPRRGAWRDGPRVAHEQLAATLARLMGLDCGAEHPTTGPPVEAILSDSLSPAVRVGAVPSGQSPRGDGLFELTPR